MKWWQRLNAPVLLLAAASLASALLVCALSWNLTFFQDSWLFLLYRQGFSAHDVLAPHNEHIVVIPVLITKLLLEVFGMTSGRPEMFAMTLTLVATAALLFVYVRRRVGPWLALLAAIWILFLGSAWWVLLWPFENEFTGAVAAGLATLLLLERGDRRADAWACLTLVVSIAFGTLGICFGLAALVAVFQTRRRLGWRRAYVALVPLFLYLLWYLGWGRDAVHHLSLENVLLAPPYVFDGFASVLGSLAGLSSSTADVTGQPDWGRPLLIAAVALIGYAYVYRRRPLPAGVWPAAAAGLSYWMFAAFNFIPGREAAAGRYVYAGAIFVLMIAANLLQGVRFDRRGLWAAAAVVLIALGPNLVQMKDGADWLKEQTALTRAGTAAFDISRRSVPPTFPLVQEVAGTASLEMVQAGLYLEAVDAYGSPAYSPRELATEAPAPARHWADVILARALPIGIDYRSGAIPNDPERCATIRGGAGAERPEVRLRPGVMRIGVAAGGAADLSLRRFSVGEYPVPVGPVPGDSTTVLRIPRDAAPAYPWLLHTEAAQDIWVCGA
jgi:hypothetical protein